DNHAVLRANCLPCSNFASFKIRFRFSAWLSDLSKAASKVHRIGYVASASASVRPSSALRTRVTVRLISSRSLLHRKSAKTRTLDGQRSENRSRCWATFAGSENADAE